MLELGAPIIKVIIELVSFFDPEVNLKPNPYEMSLHVWAFTKSIDASMKRNLLSECWCLIFECMAAGAYEYWRGDK